MTNFTPNFALPYPNGLDEPCDFAQQWCDFTEAIDTVFNRFQASIDRTVPVIPMAQFRLTESIIQAGVSPSTPNVLPAFNIEAFDTANFIDFDANNVQILLLRAGVFTCTGNVTIDTSTIVDTVRFLRILGVSGAFHEALDRATAGIDLGMSVALDALSIGTPTPMPGSLAPQLQIGNTFQLTAGITVNDAYLTVYWHADTLRPS